MATTIQRTLAHPRGPGSGRSPIRAELGAGWGFAGVWALLAGLTAAGTFGPDGAAWWWQLPGLCAVVGYDAEAIRRRLSATASGLAPAWLDALFAFLTLRLVIDMSGALASSLYGLTYLFLALLGAACRRHLVLIVTLAAIALEACAFAFGDSLAAALDVPTLGVRCALLIAFPQLTSLLLRAEVLLARRQLAAALRRDEQHSRNELERMYEASRAIARSLTLDEVYDNVLSNAAQLVQYDTAALALLRSDDTAARFEVVRAEGPPLQGLEGHGIDGGVLAEALADGRPRFLGAHRAPIEGLGLALRGLESLVVLPLRFKGEGLGCLLLGARHTLPPRKVRCLEPLVEQIAVSIAHGKKLQRMKALAVCDALTGLLNRRALSEQLQRSLRKARRNRREVSVIMCDIDHFKVVNDTHGHLVGDQVLRGVAQALRKTSRRRDIVARYGGEEFAIVLDGAHREALEAAERVRKVIREMRFEGAEGPFKVTLSLGVATFPTHAASPHTLIERADQALYRCKHEGRDCVRSA